jgi:hypothetical protein
MTEVSAWELETTVSCAHCFRRLTYESPYNYLTVAECDQAIENDQFDQVLKEIDGLVQSMLN